MMTHPFVGDLTGKTMDELSETISNLTKKQMFAARTGHHDMNRQIAMVLETYRSEYSRRQQELWNQKGRSMEDKIDVS